MIPRRGERDAQEIVRTAIDAWEEATIWSPARSRVKIVVAIARHTTCRSDGTDTTFKGCQALLEDVGRGVIEAGIEVGRDLQVKDPSGVVSTIKSEGIR